MNTHHVESAGPIHSRPYLLPELEAKDFVKGHYRDPDNPARFCYTGWLLHIFLPNDPHRRDYVAAYRQFRLATMDEMYAIHDKDRGDTPEERARVFREVARKLNYQTIPVLDWYFLSNPRAGEGYPLPKNLDTPLFQELVNSTPNRWRRDLVRRVKISLYCGQLLNEVDAATDDLAKYPDHWTHGKTPMAHGREEGSLVMCVYYAARSLQKELSLGTCVRMLLKELYLIGDDDRKRKKNQDPVTTSL